MRTVNIHTTAIALVALVLFSSTAYTQIVSRQLTDVIKSNGIGVIDIMDIATQRDNLSGADLEAYRLDGNGKLTFAIDVNEAANGTEKASTQGVAIASAQLDVMIDGVNYSFNQYWTQTQSLLMELGSATRQMYYTVIGATGTNDITSKRSDTDLDEFGGILHVTVDQDLTNATSATLTIYLLETDTSLGDPEAFYDFSNGFEGIAIVSQADAQTLDTVAAGRDEAPLVITENNDQQVTGSLYYPTAENYFIVAYEDNFPNPGDYDFNDLVVAYRVRMDVNLQGDVVGIHGDGYLIARGASFDHNWMLRMTLGESVTGSAELSVYAASSTEPADGYPITIYADNELIIPALTNTRELWQDPPHEFVNTLAQQNLQLGPRFTFSFTPNSTIPQPAIMAAPFDPILFVHNTGYEIHRQTLSPVLPYSQNTTDGNTAFVDGRGYPYALVFSEQWSPPLEYTDLGIAYPDFISFIVDGSPTDWLTTINPEAVRTINRSFWEW